MSDTPVERSGIAIGALSIQRRELLPKNKGDLSFSFAIDSTARLEDICALMDTIGAVAEREQLKEQLVERREALRVAREQPAQIDREIERQNVTQMAYIAARQANKQVGGRRLEWKPNDREKADLAQFEQQIENLRLNRKQFAADIPLIEWEIAALEARVAGNEPPPRPARFDAAMIMPTLAEAAE